MPYFRAFSAIALPSWGELTHTDCCISAGLVGQNMCVSPEMGVDMCQKVHPDVEPFGKTRNLIAKRQNHLAYILYSKLEE